MVVRYKIFSTLESAVNWIPVQVPYIAGSCLDGHHVEAVRLASVCYGALATIMRTTEYCRDSGSTDLDER